MPACPNCGEENPERARFCWSCGAVIAEAPRSGAEERKIVSVLFVDLVGFTAASEKADPEDVRARLRPYHARVKQEIERFGGTVENSSATPSWRCSVRLSPARTTRSAR